MFIGFRKKGRRVIGTANTNRVVEPLQEEGEILGQK